MEKIGIMGGTFDPIHNGHLLLGKQAYQEYHLDEIWYMPSGEPPHKKGHRITQSAHRCAMVRLAVEDEPGMHLSEFETMRSGTTYTAQTLETLRQEYPEHEFFFIMGADSLYEMENWYYPEQVLSMACVLVAERKYDKRHRSMDEQIRYLQEKLGGHILRLHCQEMDIASEQIRKMVSDGVAVDSLVPSKVAAYIKENHLYQEDSQ